MKGELSLLNPFSKAQWIGGSGSYPSIQFLRTLTGMIESKLLENSYGRFYSLQFITHSKIKTLSIKKVYKLNFLII